MSAGGRCVCALEMLCGYYCRAQTCSWEIILLHVMSSGGSLSMDFKRKCSEKCIWMKLFLFSQLLRCLLVVDQHSRVTWQMHCSINFAACLEVTSCAYFQLDIASCWWLAACRSIPGFSHLNAPVLSSYLSERDHIQPRAAGFTSVRRGYEELCILLKLQKGWKYNCQCWKLASTLTQAAWKHAQYSQEITGTSHFFQLILKPVCWKQRLCLPRCEDVPSVCIALPPCFGPPSLAMCAQLSDFTGGSWGSWTDLGCCGVAPFLTCLWVVAELPCCIRAGNFWPLLWLLRIEVNGPPVMCVWCFIIIAWHLFPFNSAQI